MLNLPVHQYCQQAAKSFHFNIKEITEASSLWDSSCGFMFASCHEVSSSEDGGHEETSTVASYRS